MASANYWDSIYDSKKSDQVSWFQVLPKTSLDFIHSFHLPKSAKIIDVGSGDSKLVDALIDEGYENITVLDISVKALNKSKERLGDRAKLVTWIQKDICEFEPDYSYDLWHDRATFHFLTDPKQLEQYMNITQKYISGCLVIGTFSDTGPLQCSGLEIKQYSQEQLTYEFQKVGFKKIRCIAEAHKTPNDTVQNFVFCSFKRIQH